MSRLQKISPSSNAPNLLDGINTAGQHISRKRLLRFLIPSIIGVLIFMTPMPLGGQWIVPIAYGINTLNTLIAPYMMGVTLIVVILPTLAGVIVHLSRLRQHDHPLINLLDPGTTWLLARVAGSVTIVMVYFQLGPQWVWDDSTGGVLLYEVAPVLMALFFVSSLLLPLLTDHGLMEFISALISRPFQRLFNLPGRAAVDCMASWISDSTVGVILTSQQYRDGYYTRREAATIATSFSIVSIAFAYVVLGFVSLQHVFLGWYVAVTLAGIVCAVIVPRLPPLSRIAHSTIDDQPPTPQVNDRTEEESLNSWALRRGVERADRAHTPSRQIRRALYTAADVTLTIYPTMMILGVLGLALIQYTPVIHYLATPLVPYLELLGLPEARAAATAMLSGFIDLLMPVILGANIESELTRFVIAGATVNGIIFLTEVAIVILKARIGLNLVHLFLIWLARLLISLPILTLMGHLIL